MSEHSKNSAEVSGENSTHTPEPWIIDEFNTPNGVGYFIDHLWDDEEGETHTDEIVEVVMDYRGNVPHANARRIIACVNACKGIPTEQLEHAASQSSDQARHDWLVKAALFIVNH